MFVAICEGPLIQQWYNVIVTYNFNRQQAETKLKHLSSHHETTETVSQQEVMEWKDKYEQSKEKAREYSELVRQGNVTLLESYEYVVKLVIIY